MKQLQLTDQGEMGGVGPVSLDSRRVPLERKVILKFHHFGGFFIEYSANISLTGMFIKTEAPKLPGSIFIFEVWLGDEHRLVHGLGEVMWVRMEDEGSDRPSGMGIRFLKIDDESRVVVERVIAEHVEKGGEVFDLAAPGDAADVDQERRAELELVEPMSEPSIQGDMLMIDEDLLGFDRPATVADAAEEPLMPPMPRTAERSHTGLRIALLLVALAVVMGGTAYLFSADLLPF